MKIIKARILLLFILSILISACTPGWEIEIISKGQPTQTINHEDVTFYIGKSSEDITSIPIGQMLYSCGYSLIDTITLTLPGDSTHSFEWDAIAPFSTLSANGTVSISGNEYMPKSILVTPSPSAATIDYSIMDISPTIANALGLPAWAEAAGSNRYDGSSEVGVMILLDGLQYRRLQALIDAGKLPFFQQYQKDIKQGLTVYPPISTSASAALLTSAPPQVNGVYGYGYRSTESTTMFDLAVEAGRSVVAVEGDSLPFNLRNAETSLSGVRDGNGFPDDNVFTSSLNVIQSGMPDILYIHFHEIDDMGHSYGPESLDYEEALIRVDGYLRQIFEALPGNTLLVIFADHGMHATETGGNHGTLTAEDMIIPILFIHK